MGITFSPSLAGAGTHVLVYSYTDPSTGCTASDSLILIVDLCSGTAEVGQNTFMLYPNPARAGDLLNVLGDFYNQPISIRINSFNGREVYSNDHLEENGTIKLPPSMPSGIYTVAFKTDVASRIIQLAIMN